MVDQLLETHNSIWLSSQNIAVRAHKVESHGFVGISCAAYADQSESHKSRRSDDFTCMDLKAEGANDKDNSDAHTEERVSSVVADFIRSFRLFNIIVSNVAVYYNNHRFKAVIQVSLH